MPDTQLLPEDVLVAKLRQGEAMAVREWYSKYYLKLVAYANTKVAATETAEELVQEAFINALKNIHFFQAKSSLLTWMVGILNHEVADFYRKQYAKRAIRVLPLSELLFVEPIADAHEVSRRVAAVLENMTHGQRELLLQKYVDKKKVRQMAKELGRSVKAIESDLFRARLEFRRLYVAAEE
jgi:RNA polymerase sigma factor (sigma-70 family)